MFTAYAFDKYERWEETCEEFEKLCTDYSEFHKDLYGFRPRDINMNPEAYRVNEWSHDTTKLDAEIVKVKGLIANMKAEFDAIASTEAGRDMLREDDWKL